MKRSKGFVCFSLAFSALSMGPVAHAITGQNPAQQPDCVDAKCLNPGTALSQGIPQLLGSCESPNAHGRRGYRVNLLHLGNASVQADVYQGGFDYSRLPHSPPPGKILTEEMQNGRLVSSEVYTARAAQGALRLNLTTAALEHGNKIQLVRVRGGERKNMPYRLRLRLTAKVGEGYRHEFVTLPCQINEGQLPGAASRKPGIAGAPNAAHASDIKDPRPVPVADGNPTGVVDSGGSTPTL